VNRLADIAIAVLATSLASPGIASADEPLGQPTVTTTFGLGAGPMPDVATDPSTHRAYVTSQGDDSLYVAGPTSRVATIKVGPAPDFAAVDPATQTAYVTSGILYR
jgi:DNA-binding beta-propeller fold protein YncE